MTKSAAAARTHSIRFIDFIETPFTILNGSLPLPPDGFPLAPIRPRRKKQQSKNACVKTSYRHPSGGPAAERKRRFAPTSSIRKNGILVAGKGRRGLSKNRARRETFHIYHTERVKKMQEHRSGARPSGERAAR